MSTGRKKPQAGSVSRKESYLQVRVSPDEKEGFETAASLSGLGVSAWVRERLRRVAREELEQAKVGVPFLVRHRPSGAVDAAE